jgi:hypothetical protein
MGVGQAVVAVELKGGQMPGDGIAFEFFGQLDALREGGELAGVAVEAAERRQALQVVPDAELVVWVTSDNTGALWLPALYCRKLVTNDIGVVLNACQERVSVLY